MKSKVVLSALALLFAAGAMAQDCTFFFPQTKGTQLVKKGYDAKGNLQSVMTYTVDEVKNIPSGLEVEADYVFKNSAGTVYDKGDLEAFCKDGEFFMEMKEVLSNPSFVSTVQSDVAGPLMPSSIIRASRTHLPVTETICILTMPISRFIRRRTGRIARTCLSMTANM